MILRNIFTLKKNRFFENLESKSPLKALQESADKSAIFYNLMMENFC